MAALPKFARSSQSRRAWFGNGCRRLLWLVLAAASALLSACDETGPRVYTAMAYDPVAQCLAPYAPLAVVDADALAATCSAVCLTLADTLYVSEVCAPYPTGAVLVMPADSADCALALSKVGADDGSCAAQTP